MAYVVRLTSRAERDLAELYRQIHAQDVAAAKRWYVGFTKAIMSLEHQPNRCSVTPENRQLRHLLYGRKLHIYRAIYRVLERQQQVDVLHIRHGARQRFRKSES